MKILTTEAKQPFSLTKIPGAKYVINQYIGCEHACKYCYAKFMCKFYSFGKWGSWVVVRENLPELVKNKHVAGKVLMSTVSDPYQPIERKLELTRKILENMNKQIRLSLLTKSCLITRDIDVLKKFKHAEVGLTINSWNEDLRKILEPRAPEIEKRILALKELNENKLETYAFISPVIPKLTDIEKIVREVKPFATFFWIEMLNLKASGYEFGNWLKENFPESISVLTDKEKLFRFVKEIKELIRKYRIEVKGLIYFPNIL